LMLLVIFFELRKKTIPRYIWNHPIVLAAGFYILILILATITSSHPIVSIKYITHRMNHTLRVKCSTKIVYSFENFNFIVRISKICVYTFMCTGMFNYFYINDLSCS
jgi:hypothetical protein